MVDSGPATRSRRGASPCGIVAAWPRSPQRVGLCQRARTVRTVAGAAAGMGAAGAGIGMAAGMGGGAGAAAGIAGPGPGIRI